MKLKIRTLLCASAAASLILSSCVNEPFEISPKEEFTRSFIKEFGLIDQHQDWNLAERACITVSTPASDVKIYAMIDGVYYLVGDYANVSGTRTLKFDVPEGTTDVIVKGNGCKVKARVGDTVELSRHNSRASYTSTTHISAGDIKVTDLLDDMYADNWLRMPKDGVLSYRAMMPEKYDNRYNPGIELNFVYSSNGPFIVHPVYWQTSADNELGIYVYCDATTPGAEEVTNYEECTSVYVLRVPVFNRKDSDIMYVYNAGNAPDDEFDVMGGNHYLKKNSTYWTQFHGGTDLETSQLNTGNDYQQLMSKGVKVDIPEGTRFGVYLKHGGSGQYFYSERALNSDPFIDCIYPENNPDGNRKNFDNGSPNTTYTKRVTQPWQASHIATFKGQERGALAIMAEDWLDGGTNSDMDINDNVFVIFGADPTKETSGIPDVTPTETILASPYQWIIAAEDLGSADDFDFNDVVIGVEHVSGQTTARLTALAAGGTLPIEVLYNGEVLTCEGESQFHSWFEGNHSPTEMINTIHSNSVKCKSKVEIAVGEDFTIAYQGDKDHAVSNMGGITLRVKDTDYITPPGTGEAPQMICVPGGWAWPSERSDIRKGYTTFANWVGDKTQNSEWYKEKESIDVNHLVFEPLYGSISVGGGNSGIPTGSGSEFVVPAPAGDRTLSAKPGATEGYMNVTVTTNNLTDASVIKKAFNYYKAYSAWTEADLNDFGVDLNQYRTNLVNALLTHYWDKAFYTAGEYENIVYPDYNPNNNIWSCLSGTAFGAGGIFMLLEVEDLVTYSYNNDLTIIAKVVEI